MWEKWKVWKKIHGFINKDVEYENEVSQFYVMMRVYYIITALYIVCFYIMVLYLDVWHVMPWVFVWLPLHILSFFTTYMFRRRAIFHIFSVGILSWLVIAVISMGWSYGAQYFIFPLMVISFFATYKNYAGKALYSFILFLIYTVLYFYGKGHAPILALEGGTENSLHFLHIIVCFLCMFVICIYFSSNNQSALEKLASYNEKLKKEAETDTLTGLMNRRCMYKVLSDAMREADRTEFTVVMGDIDFFKKINDTRGHECGDVVLQSLSSFFMEKIGSKNFVSRWGGEEFLFVFPGQKGEDVFSFVNKMKEDIQSLPIKYKGEEVCITMTFGIAQYNRGESVENIIREADERLYKGKAGGRNCVIWE